MVLLVVLAAMGLMSIGWAVLGWLLPSGKGCVLVCYGAPDPGICSRWKWLRSLGFLTCPLLVVAEEEIPGLAEEIEIYGREDVLSRLETERNRFDGTGNGNSSGHHQRRGISEL